MLFLGNRWGVFAVVAFLVSAFFAESDLSFIITSMAYMPLCLHHEVKIKISSLIIVVIFGLFAWEAHFMTSYLLSDFAYISLVTVLNLTLIINLLKSERNGHLITALYDVYDNKFNSSRDQRNQTGQNA